MRVWSSQQISITNWSIPNPATLVNIKYYYSQMNIINTISSICEVALCKLNSYCNYWNENLVHSIPKERYQKQNWDEVKTKQLFERHNYN